MLYNSYFFKIFFALIISFLIFSDTAFAQKDERKKKKEARNAERLQNEEDYFNSSYIRYDNFNYDTIVKTVQLMREMDELSSPILNINSDDIMKLSFDILSLELKNYQYTFIHCSPDWVPSPLHQAEYLDGFFDNYITDYKYSMNTLKRYVHYNIVFPNQDVRFKRSGNYIIMVYEENNREKPLLTRRLMVYEDKVMVAARINRPSVPEYRNVKQKLDFRISHTGYVIQNPKQDVKVALLQNYRWDNAVTNLQPLFIKDNELDYSYDAENMFFGGNEFRNFDIKTLRFYTQFVDDITYSDGIHQVYLKESLVRGRNPYSTEPDINGKFVIRFQEGWGHETEADYAMVHFKLKYPAPVMDGNLYVFGALTNWSYTEAAKLKYDYQSKSYRTSLLLKQGYYNYEYVFLGDNAQKSSTIFTEGSYFDAENDYTVLFYHREPTTNFFKLVGFREINSRKTL
jgi:hypothetical protein